jgi:hypothetical protein
MTDKDLDLNRHQDYIEGDHEKKSPLQLTNQRHKWEFSKNILNRRYEDLRRKVIEAEENNSLSPFFPFSQELLIFIQQGMIAWVEEWTKCHPINSNSIDIDMTDHHKIKESDFIGIDDNTEGNNYIADKAGRRDNASGNFSLSISMDLQAQVKNLLIHMAVSTILLSTI